MNNEAQAAAHRADRRTVYASGASTREQARKALADKYAQERGLKADARTYFRTVQLVKSEHIRQLLNQPIHDELNQAAAGHVDE
ncbi:hypothetical protein [Leifsonia aquatica]|uniref:hypothetical protein n=1 Tax=Leifsonia aquatica TaxID=144185 RepID=UPI00046A1784|nr:hypothetical protein [Leifsonia aquatica]